MTVKLKKNKFYQLEFLVWEKALVAHGLKYLKCATDANDFFTLVEFLESNYGFVFLYNRNDLRKEYQVGFTNFNGITVVGRHKEDFKKVGCALVIKLFNLLTGEKETL